MVSVWKKLVRSGLPNLRVEGRGYWFLEVVCLLFWFMLWFDVLFDRL